MSLLVKICGLRTEESVTCAVEAGADMVGFVFHPKSPRFVDLPTVLPLCELVPSSVKKVALVVNADDHFLDTLADAFYPADMFQLHGSAEGQPAHLAETPDRVADIRRFHGLPVMKAIGVSEAADLASVLAYSNVSDSILLDAKPPKDAAYPGGHGKVFDWSILAGLPRDLPFLLSGGLTPENVGAAIRTIRGMGLNLAGVDVSSGVESAPGVKDLGKIRAFIAAARKADAA